MTCKKCSEAGQRSTIRILGTKQTTMPKDVFFDEDGEEHNHNPNIVTTQYRCSNGHRFEERSSWQCHCGWMVLKATITFLGEGESHMGSDRFWEQQNTLPLKAARFERGLTALRDDWNDRYIALAASDPRTAAVYRECSLRLKALQDSEDGS